MFIYSDPFVDGEWVAVSKNQIDGFCAGWIFCAYVTATSSNQIYAKNSTITHRSS